MFRSVPTTARGKNSHVLEEKSRSREGVTRAACEPASDGTASRRAERRGSSAMMCRLEMAAVSQPFHPAPEPQDGLLSPAISPWHSSGPRPSQTGPGSLYAHTKHLQSLGACMHTLTTSRAASLVQILLFTFFAPWLHAASRTACCRAKLPPPRQSAGGQGGVLAVRCEDELRALGARSEELHGAHGSPRACRRRTGRRRPGSSAPRSLRAARPPSAVADGAGQRSGCRRNRTGLSPRTPLVEGNPIVWRC